MNLLNRFGLSRNNDEEENPQNEELTPKGGPSGEINDEYDDALSRLGIAGETTLGDELLTSGQSRKIRFDFPPSVQRGYSARQVDEFMNSFVTPTLDWHERQHHQRDMDVFRLGQELGQRDVEMDRLRFSSTVADAAARVDEDKEFQVLMGQLQEAENRLQLLQQDNDQVRAQYAELYPEYVKLWERYEKELAGEDIEDEEFTALSPEAPTEDDLLALDDTQRTGGLPTSPPPLASAEEESPDPTLEPLSSDDVPDDIKAEIIAPFSNHIEELTGRYTELSEQYEELVSRYEESNQLLEEAQQRVADLTAALDGSAGFAEQLAEKDNYIAQVTEQYNELVEKIEAGEYSQPEAAEPPVEWASQVETLERALTSSQEELSLAHAEADELRARLEAYENSTSEESLAEPEPPQPYANNELSPAARRIDPTDLPDGIRLEDL